MIFSASYQLLWSFKLAWKHASRYDGQHWTTGRLIKFGIRHRTREIGGLFGVLHFNRLLDDLDLFQGHQTLFTNFNHDDI